MALLGSAALRLVTQPFPSPFSSHEHVGRARALMCVRPRLVVFFPCSLALVWVSPGGGAVAVCCCWWAMARFFANPHNTLLQCKSVQ